MSARRRPSRPPSALAAVIEREIAEARAALLPLVETPLRFREARIETKPQYQTCGAVRVLCDAAATLQQRQPEYALLVADTAVAVATRLEAREALRTPALLGMALKERAVALHMIGRFGEAEIAIRRAEDAYDSDPHSAGHDLAIVWLVRANICAETDRFENALFLAQAAARQFLLFGDERRYDTAQVLIGGVLEFTSKYAEGVQITEGLIVRARASSDLMLLGRALQTAGNCYVGLKQFGQAMAAYFDALSVWDQLRLDAERTRTKWALAGALIATGDFEPGILWLQQACREFEAIGIINDAALTRLELAEALIAVGRSGEVPELLRDVVVRFASEGMTRNAQKALAYLREAIVGGRLDADVIRHVRTYLERLPLRPAETFVSLR